MLRSGKCSACWLNCQIQVKFSWLYMSIVHTALSIVPSAFCSEENSIRQYLPVWFWLCFLFWFGFFPVDLLLPALISRFQRTQECWYKPRRIIIGKEVVLAFDSKRRLYSVVRLCEQGWLLWDNTHIRVHAVIALQYFMQSVRDF